MQATCNYVKAGRCASYLQRAASYNQMPSQTSEISIKSSHQETYAPCTPTYEHPKSRKQCYSECNASCTHSQSLRFSRLDHAHVDQSTLQSTNCEHPHKCKPKTNHDLFPTCTALNQIMSNNTGSVTVHVHFSLPEKTSPPGRRKQANKG